MEHRGHRWSPSPAAFTALCIAGLAVNASILILLVPSLFQDGAQVHPLIMVGLMALCAGFTAGARYWRPSTSRSKAN